MQSALRSAESTNLEIILFKNKRISCIVLLYVLWREVSHFSLERTYPIIIIIIIMLTAIRFAMCNSSSTNSLLMAC